MLPVTLTGPRRQAGFDRVLYPVVTVLPPVTEPVEGERAVTAGTIGFHCQLSWATFWPHAPPEDTG